MIEIDGSSLSIMDVVSVTRVYEEAMVATAAEDGINKSRAFVERILSENRVVYGITTGVGELANKYIPPSDAAELQRNLVRSHAVNAGEPLSEEIVRGIILLRANALSKGFSGVRIELIRLLLDILNKKIYPYIPSKGSVGASGDLSPLSHLALVIIGEGECIREGHRVDSLKVFNELGIKPLDLQPKEGLALINGTQVMASIGCHVVYDAEILLKNAMIAAGMSLEALRGTSSAFDAKIQSARPHKGQMICAENMRRIIKDSRIIKSHVHCEKVQDAYTLRCSPQVFGPIMQTIKDTADVITVEINSATDNPLIFAEEEEVISGGNFHGEPLALFLDYTGIALSEIGSIAERTVDRLVNPHLSGLPPFLSSKNGLHSGLMITQYTAAALVSENKVLAHPASVDSIPTSANQEDHVSMGSISARHALEILGNVQNIVAIEFFAAAQGIDFHQLTPGTGTGAAHRFIRRQINGINDDRIIYKDIEQLKEIMNSGGIISAVEDKIGKLGIIEEV